MQHPLLTKWLFKAFSVNRYVSPLQATTVLTCFISKLQEYLEAVVPQVLNQTIEADDIVMINLFQ